MATRSCASSTTRFHRLKLPIRTSQCTAYAARFAFNFGSCTPLPSANAPRPARTIPRERRFRHGFSDVTSVPRRTCPRRLSRPSPRSLRPPPRFLFTTSPPVLLIGVQVPPSPSRWGTEIVPGVRALARRTGATSLRGTSPRITLRRADDAEGTKMAARARRNFARASLRSSREPTARPPRIASNGSKNELLPKGRRSLDEDA